MSLTLCEHTFCAGNEGAVSEVVGSVMLISIVVIAIAIIGVVLWSQPSPTKIPVLSAGITNQSCRVILTHNGGDLLEQQSFRIYVGNDDHTSQFTKTGSPGNWTSWAIGETLVYDPPPPCIPPDRVQIVYIGGNGALVMSSAYFGIQPSGTGTATPTTTTHVLPPSANFTATPLMGTVPLTITFTDTSTGSPAGWNWTFGDMGPGNTSTLQNPSHTYMSSGTYTVTLLASNTGGSSMTTRTNYITVNIPAPVASFTGTPLSGNGPLPVTFVDTSTNTPTGWTWSFRNITPGNNTLTDFSAIQNPVMTFGAGNYSIILNVSNSGGFNVSSQVTFVNVSRQWWYYREIIVTNSPAITDYQVKVNVPYNSHMKTDFGDIRFIGTDGITAFDYWMEKKTDSTSAVFWVKVPTANTTTFRMYYGNSLLTTTSDGSKTFDFFDDFSGDLSKWTEEKTSGIYPRIEDGYLVAGGGFTSGNYGHTSLGSSPMYSAFQDGIVEFKHQHSPDGIGEVAFRGNFAVNRGYKGRWDARSGSEQVFLMPPYSGWANLGSALPKWISAGPWYEGKLIVHGNVMELYDDGVFKGAVTDNTYTRAGEIALQNHYGSYTNFDDVRVRKYSATEPTTSIGSEITV